MASKAKAVAYKGNHPFDANIKTPFEPIKVKFAKTDVFISGSTSGSSNVIYTVPEGFTLVLEGCYVSGNNRHATDSGYLTIYRDVFDANGIGNLITIYLRPTNNSSLSWNSPRGVRLPSNSTLVLYPSNSGIFGWGGFFGYLIQNENLFYLD